MANKKQPQRLHQSGNPARRSSGRGRPTAGPTAPPQSAFRSRLNRTSAPALLWMHSLPRWVVPVGMAALLASGLFLAGSLTWLGTLLLAIVTAFVVWLYALSWPVLAPGARLARGLVSAALIGLTVLKATGRL